MSLFRRHTDGASCAETIPRDKHHGNIVLGNTIEGPNAVMTVRNEKD